MAIVRLLQFSQYSSRLSLQGTKITLNMLLVLMMNVYVHRGVEVKVSPEKQNQVQISTLRDVVI